jgi:hypothetical protein
MAVWRWSYVIPFLLNVFPLHVHLRAYSLFFRFHADFFFDRGSILAS